MATFTRPVDEQGNTITPASTTRPNKPAGLISIAANNKPQGRDIAATKRRWVERYPPMRRTASVKTFLTNLDTWRNERTSLDVVEKFTGDNETITAILVDFSDYEIQYPIGQIVFGLEIEFAEL